MVIIKRLLIVLLALICSQTSGQVKRKRNFIKKDIEVSLVSGVSTNGMDGGWYVNKYSLAIFSSMKAANRYLQIAGISTLNTQNVTGIQLAGIANIVGSNTFVHMSIGEERALMREGFKSNMTGIQFAGLLNVIRDNMYGWQMAGGINFVHDDAYALQMAGFANMVGGHMVGVQLAGFMNIAMAGSSGLQMALFSNLNNGVMQGLQISMLNKAWTIRGRYSDPPTHLTGWQVGLVNMASSMNGLQIGLINRTRKFRGTQIGLINFFSTVPNKTHGKNGVPIGLLNFGSQGGHQRIYINETFRYNLELTTGNCHNCTKTESGMPLSEKTLKLNQNALIFSYNPESILDVDIPYWAVGWGFERLHYNKNSMSAFDPNNQKQFVSYGLKFQHLNFREKIEEKLNLLTKANFTIGRKIRNKLFEFYLFGSVTANAMFGSYHKIQNGELDTVIQDKFKVWPGYELGIHLY